jgi:hypothetical protein
VVIPYRNGMRVWRILLRLAMPDLDGLQDMGSATQYPRNLSRPRTSGHLSVCHALRASEAQSVAPSDPFCAER